MATQVQVVGAHSNKLRVARSVVVVLVAFGLLAPVTTSTYAHPPGITDLVSLSSQGVEGEPTSQLSSMSADGRFVVFTSGATNLVPGDTNGFSDVFVRDRQWGPPSVSALLTAGASQTGVASLAPAPSAPTAALWCSSPRLTI